jgi:CHAD domain-containing protein
MRADEPICEALHEALRRGADELRERLRRARRGDADGVHDARTKLRRLREGLVVMARTVFDAGAVGKLERGLHAVESALGPTRDDDVLLADVDRWIGRARRDERRDLAALRETVYRRRRRHMRRLARELRRDRLGRHVRRARRWLRGGPRNVSLQAARAPKATPNLVRHFVPDLTWRAYEEVLAYEMRLPADFDVVHKVRSAARRLRYLLELLDQALPPGACDLVDALRALQDRLGDLHDHVEAVTRIETWVARGKIANSPALESYLAHRRRERDRLRREFDGEWRALAGEPFRFALSHLVSGEMEMRNERPDGAIRLTRR